MWNTFHSKKKWARYDQKCMSVLTRSTRYSCSILKKLEFSRRIFAKYWNIKFNENPFSGSRVVLPGRTDRHDKANIRCSRFCERAQKGINQSLFLLCKSSNCRRSDYTFKYINVRGPGSSVGIATDIWAGRSGIESRWGTRFSARPDRPWGPPSLL